MRQDKVYLAGPSVSAAGCQNLFQTEREFGKWKREGHGRHTARNSSTWKCAIFFPFHSQVLMFCGALTLGIVSTGKAKGLKLADLTYWYNISGVIWWVTLSFGKNLYFFFFLKTSESCMYKYYMLPQIGVELESPTAPPATLHIRQRDWLNSHWKVFFLISFIQRQGGTPPHYHKAAV